MSAFSGPQGKGARKRHKDAKRREAEQRQAQYEALGGDLGLLADVERVMFEQNVSPNTARYVVRAERKMLRLKEARA